MTDPIVEEVRKARREHAEKFDFDLDAICEDLRKLQNTSGRKIVAFPPRKKKPKISSGLVPRR